MTLSRLLNTKNIHLNEGIDFNLRWSTFVVILTQGILKEDIEYLNQSFLKGAVRKCFQINSLINAQRYFICGRSLFHYCSFLLNSIASHFYLIFEITLNFTSQLPPNFIRLVHFNHSNHHQNKRYLIASSSVDPDYFLYSAKAASKYISEPSIKPKTIFLFPNFFLVWSYSHLIPSNRLIHLF